MELKWLDDFISLARTRSFSRSAEERHVTQSAFSRRIQALESWLGTALIDRSMYPTTLTAEGRRFLVVANETANMLYAARLELLEGIRPVQQMVSIAALHTLSLRFFPRWLHDIESYTGQLSSRLLSDDFHSCLQAIVEGGYDFLLTFNHPSVPLMLDPDLFPHVVIGSDRLVAAVSPALPAASADRPLPLLSYARDSFLGRVAAFAQRQAGAPHVLVTHINENAMADALRFMVLEGLGLAWLPRSLIQNDLADGTVVMVGPEIPLEIHLYQNIKRSRAIVEKVFAAAKRKSGAN